MSGTTETDAESETASVRRPFVGYRTWVDHLIGDVVGPVMVGRALLVSLVPLALGLLVAVAGGAGRAYLSSPSTYLVGSGILVTTLSYGWGSRKFLSLWDRVGDAFDIEEAVYEATVTEGLDAMYDDRAILGEFLVAVVAVVSLQTVVTLPAAIPVGFEPLGDVLGVTIRYGDVIQHVVGVVVLLYAVTGVHMATVALVLLYRVSQFPLVAPQTAARELEPLGDFSVLAASLWFLVVVLVVLTYRPWFGYLLDLGFALGIGFWVTGTVAGLLLVGVGVFVVPQLAFHAALVDAKRNRLRELEEELELVVEAFRAGERGRESVSTSIELYDRRRERVKEARTWLVDLPGVAQLVGSGLVATVSVLSQVGEMPWV